MLSASASAAVAALYAVGGGFELSLRTGVRTVLRIASNPFGPPVRDTNVTSRDKLTINDLNQELPDDELDGVSGGLVVIAIIPILIGLLLRAVNSARAA